MTCLCAELVRGNGFSFGCRYVEIDAQSCEQPSRRRAIPSLLRMGKTGWRLDETLILAPSQTVQCGHSLLAEELAFPPSRARTSRVPLGNSITLHIQAHKNAALVCDRQCHWCCKPAATSAVGHPNGPVRVQLTDWGLLSSSPQLLKRCLCMHNDFCRLQCERVKIMPCLYNKVVTRHGRPPKSH